MGLLLLLVMDEHFFFFCKCLSLLETHYSTYSLSSRLVVGLALPPSRSQILISGRVQARVSFSTNLPREMFVPLVSLFQLLFPPVVRGWGCAGVGSIRWLSLPSISPCTGFSEKPDYGQVT